ncbi:hypothetical protein BDW67DRAFT_189146 [Aspergillus spinulosporus]
MSDGLEYTTYNVDETAEKNKGVENMAQKINTAAEELRQETRNTGKDLSFVIHQDVIQEANESLTTPLKVPGLHGLPINALRAQDQFASGVNDWYGHILTVKELEILALINKLTDQPDWHHAVFDQQVTAQWRESAVASSSLINDKTWDWCLEELQDKARQFDRDGHLVVFNTSSGVYKSDTAINSDLKSRLLNSVDLLSHQAIRHKQESTVVNLVDPSLFPLVYGRTKILDGGQSCGMDKHSWSSRSKEGPLVSEPPPNWQKGAQSVDFTGPPGSTDVQIASYINNLHPVNRDTYSAIEAVISSSIKQWNEILVRNKWRKAIGLFFGNCVSCPREPMRIRTYGVDWKAQFPEWAKKLPHKEDEDKLSAEEYEAMCAQVEAYLQEPESKDEVHWDQVRTVPIPADWKARWGLLRTALTKYGHTFVFEHSDPGTAYSYEDWKAGRTGKAIVGPAHHDHVCRPDYDLSLFFDANPWLTPYEWMYKPKEDDPDDHQFYTITLQDEFREHGLQVVVRIHSIELDPETPSFSGEKWHTEGNANERIVANSIYVVDSENMSEPQISFRQRCRRGGVTWVYDRIGAIDSDAEESDLPIDMFMKRALWDVKYIGKLFGFENIQYAPAWQNLGEVKVPPGRLISFPNAFQHRMGPLQLQDKTKPGHCRFFTLSLVDPTYRLCSTWNVPPQQPGWIKGDGAEPVTQIDLEEALDLREELLKEHIEKDQGVFDIASTLTFSGFS